MAAAITPETGPAMTAEPGVTLIGEPGPAIGWAEKWKDDTFKYADVDYYGTIYKKQGSNKKSRVFKS